MHSSDRPSSGFARERSSTPTPHIGPVLDEHADWEQFDASELAIVLSHYDLGVIERIRQHRRGSRKAPKLRIRTREGEFLLKRRASARDDPFRVAFTHDLQLYLARQAFPVPRIIGTRGDNNSMLQLGGRIYELFEYVEGRRYDRSSAQAEQAGATLGELHRLLDAHHPQYPPPRGSYHAVAELESKIEQVPRVVGAVDPQADQAALAATCGYLREAYEDASRRVSEAGYADLAPGIVHGDWHPGNLLYRDGAIVAVLDFDSARLEPRISDIANAALQFSMLMKRPEDPASWPDGFDAQRIRGLLRGYDQAATTAVSPDERRSVPWLIIEALILESVVPIAATGTFARVSGASFLQMVERKVRWLRPRERKLVEYIQPK